MTLKPFIPIVAAVLVAASAGVFLAPKSAVATSTSPATGWTIHIDAKKHFGDAHPDEIAHHWCKNVDGMIECQIYDADSPGAHLVAVETIVVPATFQSFDPHEKTLWHYHKDEIPKVDAKTPDMTPDEAKQLVASLTETYGKVFVLWDPASASQPVGNPWVSVLK